ncbi:hypothetical protein [Salinactinospora qingdaonensis]|uniref:Uncharacterized protein n=1 Tax=Salinactinospora qingdaonensis TaxID=702744 RepID=A0ABP7FHW4_9ACTN
MRRFESSTPDEPRRRRGRAWATGLAFLAVAGAVAALALTLPEPAPVPIHGRLRCASTAPVVGIWVESSAGGNGWAQWRVREGDPSQVSFDYELRRRGAYTLHVGCGGTRTDWAATTRSPVVSRARVDMVCHDEHPDRRCVPAG